MEPFTIKKRIQSFGYAWRGIRLLVSKEHNAWIHGVAILLVTVAGFCFQLTNGEWLAIVLSFGLVLGAEAINTAIERLVDLVSPQQNPLAGEVKDIAAGAVFLCAITAAVVGLIVFVPYFKNFL